MYAGNVGKTLIEQFARIPVSVNVASEYRYSDPIVGPGDLVIVISQSGETADTLAALRLAKQKGADTLGIINVIGSSIAREANHVIYTHAGPEIAVASTKAFTVQMAVMFLVALELAWKNGVMDADVCRAHTEDLAGCRVYIEQALETGSGYRKDGTGSHRPAKSVLHRSRIGSPSGTGGQLEAQGAELPAQRGLSSR